jgi:hypothetical protein
MNAKVMPTTENMEVETVSEIPDRRSARSSIDGRWSRCRQMRSASSPTPLADLHHHGARDDVDAVRGQPHSVGA